MWRSSLCSSEARRRSLLPWFPLCGVCWNYYKAFRVPGHLNRPQTSVIHVWIRSCNPSTHHPVFSLCSRISPQSTILQSWVRSDLLLFSIPIPPSAICHSWVLTAKHLLWKGFKALTVSHSTFFFFEKIKSLHFTEHKVPNCKITQHGFLLDSFEFVLKLIWNMFRSSELPFDYFPQQIVALPSTERGKTLTIAFSTAKVPSVVIHLDWICGICSLQ